MDEFNLRPPRENEVGAVTELVNELGRSLHGEDMVDAAEVEKWFTIPPIDRERDLCVAELADGTLAGYGSLADWAEDHSVLWLRVVLHPSRGAPEIGDELLSSLERGARERGVDGSRIHASCASKDERAKALYERHGYRLARHFFRMQIDLDEAPPQPVWPEGFELRPLDVERDIEPVFWADDEAFADHWGYVRVPFDAWRAWMTGGHFDPSLWFIVWAGDEVAGFSLCSPEEAGDKTFGWVGVLGVRPRWRRRGLALALLQHSFAEFHRRGHKRVGLGVDAENTTGAVRLYERAGMHVVRQGETWEKPFSALAEHNEERE